MWKSKKTGGEGPDIPDFSTGIIRKIKGVRISFEHFRIDGQSFYSISWEDAA
ncbi:MAG: hypothetical protein JSW28_04715 [Thermoplasmata archaeon]|nr:MAG: hypothetical protein JSW28_04715 [Thermoplasmata archaeon]